MRFHHSTRRGRTKFSQGGGPHHRASGGGPAASHSAISNRWAQLSYCRQTNIHFNRRLPVEVPESARTSGQAAAADECWQAQQPPPPQGNGEAPLEHHMGQLRVASERERESSGSNDDGEQRKSKLGEEEMAGKMVPLRNKTSRERTGNKQNNNNNNKNSRRSICQSKEIISRQGTTTTTGDKKLDMEGAREKLIAQVEKHPFWSNKAAKRMRLLDLLERRIFIYELVSYCEKRDLEWRYEPYRGGLATGGLGVRRVLSSVGERQVASTAPIATSSLLPSSTDANNNNLIETTTTTPLKQRLRAAYSASQPASPLAEMAAASIPLEPQTRHQFAFETGDESSQKLALSSKQQLSVSNIQDNSNKTTRRQAIRRSCSSAVTSPSHNSPPLLPSSTSQLASQSSLGLAGGEGALSWGEQRALPSAELVWSIEPPERLRPAPFASYIHTTEVPDSSFVKRCHGCQGRGRLKCTSCYGVGYEVCISCSGKGTMKSLSSSAAAAANSASNFASGNSLRNSRTDSASSGGGTLGSMWNNASDSESRLGSSSRYDEPGGISGGGGSSSAWTTESCHFCHGAGQKRCWICAGRAYNTCTACAGTGQLRCYLNLNITWTNHRDECVLNNADAIIPRDRLRLSSGLLLADEIASRLAPIAPHSGTSTNHNNTPPPPPVGESLDGAADCAKSGTPTRHDTPTKQLGRQPLEQLVKASELSQLQAFSAKLLEKHANQYEQCERLLRQRHRVTQIECYLVNWEWKRRRGHFVIYGDERKVYIAKYPFKSICNIT